LEHSVIRFGGATNISFVVVLARGLNFGGFVVRRDMSGEVGAKQIVEPNPKNAIGVLVEYMEVGTLIISKVAYASIFRFHYFIMVHK
jgi:hypothetical protein